MRLGTITFLAGIMIGLQFTDLPPLAWSILLFPLLLVSLRFPRLRSAAMLVMGVLWLSLRASLVVDGTLATKLEGKDAIIEGSIVSIPVIKEDYSRFTFAVENMHVDGLQISDSKRLRLTWYGRQPVTVKSGQRWRLTVRLKRPYGTMNPGGFDYEAWLFQNRINATGYVRQAANNQRLPDRGLTDRFFRLRQHLLDRIGIVMSDMKQSGIIQALALGERGRIAAEQWQRLQATGTNHLVAISGLHIGLVAAGMFVLARWLWLRSPLQSARLPAARVAAILAWCAAFFYAALAGFSLPTQRALVMLSVVMLGVIWQRPLILSYVWALSLLAVLVYDPLAPLSAGFWLSYAAVGVIIFTLGNRLTASGLWWRWGRVHVVIALGLAPLLFVLFQQLPLLSPLANFFAVPLVSFVTVPLTLTALVFIDLLPAVAHYLLLAADYSLIALDTFLIAIHRYSKLPVNLPAASGGALISLVVGTVWLLLPRGWPARWLGLAGFLPLFFAAPSRPAVNHYWLTVLDVGQGLAVVVETQHHVLLYDTGARYSEQFDMGAAVVLPYLRHKGINKIDILLISHADNDHIGGAQSVLNGIQVDKLLAPPTDYAEMTESVPCQAGYTWHWDGVDFELLHPNANYIEKNKRRIRNNRSCVLRISNGAESVLLPGDVEKGAEKSLLAHAGDRLKADIILAPHHGSLTSSTAAFVEKVNPDYVVFAVGYRNRYGFPKEKVVKRYQEIDAKGFRTDDSGALQFVLDTDGEIAQPLQYRLQQRRFWHTRR